MLKREMELQKEKDMIEKQLEEQRKIAEETKAKLRELENVVCAAGPKEPEKQGKLIDELNHTLVATHERLEQKEFVLDEKEIEVLEKDELVERLCESLEVAEQPSASQESKNAELISKLKFRTKLKCAEEELLQAKVESEMAIEKRKREKSALQDKVQHDGRVVSEGGLRELYRTIEEKTQRLADLEQELSELPKKDSKIRELEITIRMLHRRSAGDKYRLLEQQQMIQKQRIRIIQLEACKDDLELQQKKTTAGEMRIESLKEELNQKDKLQEQCTKHEAAIEKLNGDVRVAEEAYKKAMSDKFHIEEILKGQEDQITDFKKQVENLEEEMKKLKKKLKGKDSEVDTHQLEEQSCEAEALRSKVSSLQVEVEHLRSISDLNLEEEIKKVKTELKAKELDLFHVNNEKSKQLDRARDKIHELEKDISNYARRNNELKAEIRSLTNGDEEPTVDLIHCRPSSSSNGDVSLSATVEKLSQENKQLHEKSENLQKEVDKLSIINLDLSQRCRQITEKYKKLKEKFASVRETQQKMNEVQPAIRQNNEPTKRYEAKETVLRNSEPAFRHCTGHSVFKPSRESEFKKPSNSSGDMLYQPSNNEIKPASPIPSQQASKLACFSIGLPRRVEPEQGRSMPANRR